MYMEEVDHMSTRQDHRRSHVVRPSLIPMTSMILSLLQCTPSSQTPLHLGIQSLQKVSILPSVSNSASVGA